MTSDFGALLRDTRRSAGLSQNQLATRSGIPKPRLSRYENGHILPSIATLRTLASALGVPEGTLLGDDASPAAAVSVLSEALAEAGVRIETREQAEIAARAAAEALGAHRHELTR